MAFGEILELILLQKIDLKLDEKAHYSLREIINPSATPQRGGLKKLRNNTLAPYLR